MAQIIHQHPSEISIVAIGSLINIVLLFHYFPETRSQVKELIIIGGCINKWVFIFANDPNATDCILQLPISTSIKKFKSFLSEKILFYNKLQWRWLESVSHIQLRQKSILSAPYSLTTR